MSQPKIKQLHTNVALIGILTTLYAEIYKSQTITLLVVCLHKYLPELIKFDSLSLGLLEEDEKISLYQQANIQMQTPSANLLNKLLHRQAWYEGDDLYLPLIDQTKKLQGFLCINSPDNTEENFVLLSNLVSILSQRIDEILHNDNPTNNFAWETVDALSAHVAVLNENGDIIAVNRAWREFASQNGTNPSVVSEGINYLAVCDSAAAQGDEDARMFAKGIRQVLYENETEFVYEYPCHSPDVNRWFMARTTRINREKPIQVVIAHENVTRIKLAEEIERHQRALAEALLDITTALNSTLKLEEVLSRILTHLMRVVPHDDANITLFEDNQVRVVSLREEHHNDSKITDDIGQEHDLGGHLQEIINTKKSLILDNANFAGLSSYSGAPILINGDVIGVINLYAYPSHYFNQTQVERLQVLANHAAIAIQNAKLYEHAQQFATLEERQRLANDLHDSVSQTLFSADLIAQSLPRLWKINPERASSLTNELHELTSGAQAEMRNLLLELRPSAINTVEIFNLLRQLANAFIGRTRIPISVSIEKFTNLPIDVKKSVYRVAQESLNNIARHAYADTVWIHLVQRPGPILTLTIEDDGCGFDMANYVAHHGLSIMRERVQKSGGEFILEAIPGQGTRIQANWQLDDIYFAKLAH